MSTTPPDQADDMPMMSLSEFTKTLGRRPIKLDEANVELAKYGLKLAMRYKQGRHETGLIKRADAERVIEEQKKVAPRRFEPAADRSALLEQIAAGQKQIIDDLSLIKTHLKLA